MSNPLAEVNTTVIDAFNNTVDMLGKFTSSIPENITTVFAETSKGAFATFETVTLFFTTNILPHVQALVDKIQNVDFAAMGTAVVEFLKSDLGIASSLLGGSIFCVVTARKANNDFAAVALVTAAIGSAVFSSFMFFKPELIRAAVGV